MIVYRISQCLYNDTKSATSNDGADTNTYGAKYSCYFEFSVDWIRVKLKIHCVKST